METTIYEIQARAQVLREKTQEGSITPEEVGGLIADTLVLLANIGQREGGLRVSRVYSSKAEMEADTNPENAQHQPLKAGQLVVIHTGGDSPENGTVYVYLAPGWKLIGNLNRVAIGESEGLAYPGMKGKKLAEDLNTLRADINTEATNRENGDTAIRDIVATTNGVVADLKKTVAYLSELEGEIIKKEYVKDTYGSVEASIEVNSTLPKYSYAHFAPLDGISKLDKVRFNDVDAQSTDNTTLSLFVAGVRDDGTYVIQKEYTIPFTKGDTEIDLTNYNIEIPTHGTAFIKHVDGLMHRTSDIKILPAVNFGGSPKIGSVSEKKIWANFAENYAFDYTMLSKVIGISERVDDLQNSLTKDILPNLYVNKYGSAGAVAKKKSSPPNSWAFTDWRPMEQDVILSLIEFQPTTNNDDSLVVGIAEKEGDDYVVKKTYQIAKNGFRVDLSEYKILVPSGSLVIVSNRNKLYDTSVLHVENCYYLPSSDIVEGNRLSIMKQPSWGMGTPNYRIDYSIPSGVGKVLSDYIGGSVTEADATAVLHLGSSVTYNATYKKTTSWLERLNDKVDVNLVNYGISGGSLQTNVTRLLNNEGLLLDPLQTLQSLRPSYIMCENNNNMTPAGDDLYTIFKNAKHLADSVGAKMIIGEEETAGEHNSYRATAQAFAREYGLPYIAVNSIITTLFPRTEAPYKGWYSGMHGGFRSGAPYMALVDLIGRLPIKKSIKLFKVRETYKNGTPNIGDLVYDDNFEREKYWRATCCGVGGNVPVSQIDNLDNQSNQIALPSGYKEAMADTETRAETSMFKRGAAISFYKYALIEFILDRLHVTRATFKARVSTVPTKIYLAIARNAHNATSKTPTTEFVELPFVYENGLITAEIERPSADFQKYDKVKIVVHCADAEAFTLSSPSINGYDGDEKCVDYSILQSFRNRQVGIELLDKTSVESGWSLNGEASIKAFPDVLANYTNCNKVKQHIQLESDGASCEKSIAIQQPTQRVAIRIVACLFPKVMTKRFNGTPHEKSEFISLLPTVRPADYDCGTLKITCNKFIVRRCVVESGWTECYVEVDLSQDDKNLQIKIERETFVDDSYINNQRPVLIHDVSVQRLE